MLAEEVPVINSIYQDKLRKANMPTFVTSHPIKVDFLSGQMIYRANHASLRGELLARAMGLKKNKTLRIVDATAGLARDAFIVAALGFQITLLERSPIIHALLEDGIKRALQNTQV